LAFYVIDLKEKLNGIILDCITYDADKTGFILFINDLDRENPIDKNKRIEQFMTKQKFQCPG
jgi:hypothetical protein